MKKLFVVLTLLAAAPAFAQSCPDKNLLYWQAFPAGGESDLSARHQQLVLKRFCSTRCWCRADRSDSPPAGKACQ